MYPDEDHQPNLVTYDPSLPLSPKTLILETSAPQTFAPPDHGPQKPLIFQEHSHMDEDADPSIATPNSPQVAPNDAVVHSTRPSAVISRRGHRGKKHGPKWRGKVCQQKIGALLKSFKPVPFSPAKDLDFARHEDLLRRLGLWEFVNVSFDRALRSNLIVQLLATFKKKERCSYVNGVRILVNRADLARALKLPQRKKERASSGLEISVEKLENVESIEFLLDFVSNWVLLHDEMFILPDNVLSWYDAIKQGRFESLDWPEMMWFMVEKELTQGPALKNCYYASHLQCLIRTQREELLREEMDAKDEDEDMKMVDLEEQSLDLSLGNEAVDSADVEEKEDAVSAEVGGGRVENFGSEKRDGEDDSGIGQEENRVGIEDEDNAGAGVREEAQDSEYQSEESRAKAQAVVADVMAMKSEDEEEQEGEQLFLDGQNDTGGQLLRQCSFKTVRDFDMGYDMDKMAEEGEGEEEHEMEEQEVKEEDVDDDEDNEEEREDEPGGFHMSENLNDLEGLSSANLIQLIDNGQMLFSSGLQVRDDSCGEFLACRSRAETNLGSGRPSVYGNLNKREMDHPSGLLLNSGADKRMRTEPLDFSSCNENALSWIEKMRMAHEASEQMWATSTMNQQMLLNELQQRESVIEHLQKARAEDQQKMQHEIYKLERELFMMERLLEGYRKALKESNRAFSEYRARCPQLDEPLYRDAPLSGGLVLSVIELEKQRLKREEEERMKLLIIKERMEDFEAMWSRRFEAHLEGVDILASRLLRIEDEMKSVKDLAMKRKVGEEKAEESGTHEKALEHSGPEIAGESAENEMVKESTQAETEG